MRPTAKLTFVLALASVATAGAQEQKPPAKPAQPQFRVNYLNVCTPAEAEKAEILAALDRVPSKPKFATDFEVSRGRSTMNGENLFTAGQNAEMNEGPPPVSNWVRIRREFPEKSSLSNVQYSFSVTEEKAVETLVFRMREAKDVMQVSISDTVTAGTDPAKVVTVSTPADRIRLERFGKSSVVLSRCENADQSAYEALFQKASALLANYRTTLGVRRIVAQELPEVLDKPAHAAKKSSPVTKAKP